MGILACVLSHAMYYLTVQKCYYIAIHCQSISYRSLPVHKLGSREVLVNCCLLYFHLHLMAMFVVNLQRPQIPENCPDKWKELMTKGWKAEPEV